MAIRVARDGKEIGNWGVSDLQDLLDRGEVLPNDLVWTKGFKDWKLLSDANAQLGLSLPAIDIEVVPPIPGSAGHRVGSPSQLPSSPSKATGQPGPDMENVSFRRKRRSTGYGLSAGTKFGVLLALLAGGAMFITTGLPWLQVRLASNFVADESFAAANRASPGSVTQPPRSNAINVPDGCGSSRFVGELFVYPNGGPEINVIKRLIDDGQFEVLSLRLADNGYCYATIRVQGIAGGNSFSRTMEGALSKN